MTTKEVVRMISEEMGITKKEAYYMLMYAWRKGIIEPEDAKTCERVKFAEICDA